jgi:hypothetical protein
MKFDLPRMIHGKPELSANYSVKRHAFPGYNSRKVKTSRIIPQKGMPCRDRICRKACHCGLLCFKVGFTVLKSAGSFYFPRIILQKGMSFRKVIHRKSELSANYPAESLSIPWKVIISLFKGIQYF